MTAYLNAYFWGQKDDETTDQGEGTIYQRKDKRWVGQYTVDTLDGAKRRSVYGKNKKDVRARLTEAIANRDKGLVFDTEGLTVSEYLDAVGL